MNGSLHHLRSDPQGCCGWLNETLSQHGIHIAVTGHDTDRTVLTVMCDAVTFDDDGTYPAEVVTVVVDHDGDIQALPALTDGRSWHHRFPWHTLAEILRGAAPEPGKLCLWYVRDPRRLRWEWSDGLDTYLLIVQRHLLAEEYYRRHRHWPTEDAPHGIPGDGKPHPIISTELRDAS